MPYEKFADGTSKDLSDEIPFDLPQGWAWARLAVLSKIISAKPYQILESEIQEMGLFPVVSQGRWHIDGYCDSKDKVLSDVPLILFGDHTRIVKYIHFPFIVGADGTKLFKPYTNEKWLYLWTSHAATIQLKSRGYGRHWNLLNHLLIPLPPLAEQKRIVAKVEELFEYAEQIGSASEGITKTAQRLDKKILDLAIRGKLVPQDPNNEPARDLVKRIEAARNEKTGSKKSRAAASHKPTYEIEPPFDIPESWEWVRLGDAVQFMSGNTPSKDALVSEGIPYFKVAEMNLPGNECVLKHTSLYVSKAATIKKFPKGTIVFPKNGGAMLTNKKRILGQESVCDLNTGGLKSYIEDMTDYLFLWFVSIDLGKYVKGGVIPTTDVDKLRTTPIPLPPLAEQKRIVKKIDELKEMTQALVAL